MTKKIVLVVEIDIKAVLPVAYELLADNPKFWRRVVVGEFKRSIRKQADTLKFSDLKMKEIEVEENE